MSSSHRGRPRDSFAKRGRPSQKKTKRKKQDYRKQKVKPAQDQASTDLETLIARTIQSLESLGHQVFAPDLGYDMNNWLKSLNTLLDDFESKATLNTTLPEEYLTTKQQVISGLSKPPDLPELESAITQAKSEQEQLAASLGAHDATYYATTLGSLKEQRDQTAADLEMERARLAEKKPEQPRPGFFRRLFGSKPTAKPEPTSNTAQIEKRLAELDSQITTVQAEEAHHRENSEKLAQARKKLADLEAQKLQRLQLIPEREEATKLLTEAVSKIRPPQP